MPTMRTHATAAWRTSSEGEDKQGSDRERSDRNGSRPSGVPGEHACGRVDEARLRISVCAVGGTARLREVSEASRGEGA